MASKPIEITVVTSAETRELEQIPDALEDVEKGLENVEDAGKDTERALDKSFGKVEDSLEDVSREGEKTGEKLEDSLKEVEERSERVGKAIDKDLTQALGEVKSEAKTTGRSVGRDLDEGFDKAARAADDFKGEAGQSGREAAASFSGEFDDVGDFIQETLANGLAGAGPIGAAAGIALAAGFGALYTKIQEDAEKAEERVQEMYDDFLESQSKYLSESYITDQFYKIQQGADDAVIGLGKVKDISEQTGLTQQQVALAFAGDTEAGIALTERLTQAREDFNKKTEGYSTLEGPLLEEQDALLSSEGMWDKRTGLIEETSGAVQKDTEFLKENGYGAKEAAEARRELVEALAGQDDAIAGANEAIAENNEALKGNADQLRKENLAALSELAGELLGVQDAAVEAGTGTEELSALQRDQAEAFISAAEAAGIERDGAIQLAQELGLIPEEVVTDIEANNSQALSKAAEAKRKLDELQRMDIQVPMRLGINPSEWQRQVNAAAARIIPPSIGINTKINQRQI